MHISIFDVLRLQPSSNQGMGKLSEDTFTGEPFAESQREARPSSRYRTILTLAVVFSALYGLGIKTLPTTWPFQRGLNTPSSRKAPDGSDPSLFAWPSIVPSKDLAWTRCYDKFECARFLVPLDYANPAAGDGAIALIRSPSLLPHDHPEYKGPVLFNPGGPGGSGVGLLRIASEAFRTLLGDGYDLIGFDPRGVMFTTPPVRMFQSAGEAGMFYLMANEALNATSSALGTVYGVSHNLGSLAKDRVGNVAQYVGTPAVARDMLGIIKAYGYDKLQYWGFSYGTVLGATFATMFPDNVGRVVLDGVVDTDDYYSARWETNLRDTDKGLKMLFQRCVDLGPKGCPMYDTSAKKIHDRVQTMLEKLRIEPISFYNKQHGLYGVVDYTVVKTTIFVILYSPINYGLMLLAALAELEQENPDPELFWIFSGRMMMQSLFGGTCKCPAPDVESVSAGWEAPFPIACGDGEPNTDDLETVRGHYERMAGDSIFAEVWNIHMMCEGWKIRAKETFRSSSNTSTSHPLLFIGNSADPVTPLSGAYKMSRRFKGSVVLKQDSPGHCSLAAISLCTFKAVRDYFWTGALPGKGTTCDITPYSTHFADLEDRRIIDAVTELQRLYPVEMPMRLSVKRI